MFTERETKPLVDAVFSAAYRELIKLYGPGKFSWDKVVAEEIEFSLNGTEFRAGKDPLNERNSLTVDAWPGASLPWSIIFVKHIKFKDDTPLVGQYHYDIIFDSTSVVDLSRTQPWNTSLKAGFVKELERLITQISPNILYP